MTATQMQCSNEAYHADTAAISASGLKLIDKSAKHYWAKYLDPDRVTELPTPAMLFGSLVHSITLEPEKTLTEYAVMPQGIDRRTKDGKAIYSEWESKNIGKTVVDQGSYDLAKSVSGAALTHPAGGIITKSLGCAEMTLYWDEKILLDDETFEFVKCKARMDYVVPPGSNMPAGCILDLKTTKDASQAFQKDAFNLGYHIQAAFYIMGFRAAYGVTPPFLFLAVEKEAPFCCSCFTAGDEFIQAGFRAVNRLLKKYAMCKRENNWPGYSEDIQELHLPAWAKD